MGGGDIFGALAEGRALGGGEWRIRLETVGGRLKEERLLATDFTDEHR